jgi:hypothetical protein
MHSPRLQLLRAAMLASMTALNFWALQYLQLAETGAMQFSVPILIALLSAWWLGERLDARALGSHPGRLCRRAAGHPAGFAGLSPGHPAEAANAVLYAGFNLLTRRMAATESPQAMQLHQRRRRGPGAGAGGAVAVAGAGQPAWGLIGACAG